MSDSGKFGPAMKNVPNANNRPLVKVKGKAPSGGSMPAVKPHRTTMKVQGGNISNASTLNQGKHKHLGKVTVKQARNMPLRVLEKRLK